MPTSVKEFFDRRVPDLLAREPQRGRDMAAVYVFKISGADGGTWTADLKATPPACVPGAVGVPDCTVEVSDEDFRTMIDGGMQVAMQLFFAGKLKITGDPNLATKLSRLLQIGAA